MLCESTALPKHKVFFSFLNVLVFLVVEEENNVTIDMRSQGAVEYIYIYNFFSLKKHIKWIFWLMCEQVSCLCEKFVHFSWNLENVVY